MLGEGRGEFVLGSLGRCHSKLVGVVEYVRICVNSYNRTKQLSTSTSSPLLDILLQTSNSSDTAIAIMKPGTRNVYSNARRLLGFWSLIQMRQS